MIGSSLGSVCCIWQLKERLVHRTIYPTLWKLCNGRSIVWYKLLKPLILVMAASRLIFTTSIKYTYTPSSLLRRMASSIADFRSLHWSAGCLVSLTFEDGYTWCVFLRVRWRVDAFLLNTLSDLDDLDILGRSFLALFDATWCEVLSDWVLKSLVSTALRLFFVSNLLDLEETLRWSYVSSLWDLAGRVLLIGRDFVEPWDSLSKSLRSNISWASLSVLSSLVGLSLGDSSTWVMPGREWQMVLRWRILDCFSFVSFAILLWLRSSYVLARRWFCFMSLSK